MGLWRACVFWIQIPSGQPDPAQYGFYTGAWVAPKPTSLSVAHAADFRTCKHMYAHTDTHRHTHTHTHTRRYGLAIGANLSWLVMAMMAGVCARPASQGGVGGCREQGTVDRWWVYNRPPVQPRWLARWCDLIPLMMFEDCLGCRSHPSLSFPRLTAPPTLRSLLPDRLPHLQAARLDPGP